MADADQFLALLGRRANDPTVEAALVSLRTRRRPELDPHDPEAVFDFVLVRRQGVEVGFVDEVYFTAGNPLQRRQPNSPLVLFQIYFYRQLDDAAPFQGKLPFGIDWTDDRQQVRQKLLLHDSLRRSHTKDFWALPDYRMTVDYNDGDGTINALVCQLDLRPWPEKERLQPNLGVPDWLSLLGLPSTTSTLRKQLQPLDLAARIREEDDDHEVQFLFECGLELVFVTAGGLKVARPNAQRKVAVKKNQLVLGGVRFYRSRFLDARQWNGPLPMGLSFDDSQETMVQNAGRPPDEQEDEDLDGYALWHFPDHSVHVLYDNMENHLLRITLAAPGFF